MVEEEVTMYCPLRQGDCKFDECMLFVNVNGIRLGCAITVTAKQLDKLAFTLRRQKKDSTTQNDQY